MIRYAAAVAVVLLLTSCGDTRDPGPVVPDREPVAPAPESVQMQEQEAEMSGSAFGTALYEQLNAEPGNVVISPVSILAAFGVVVEGARSGTRDAILSSLRLPTGPSPGDELGGLLRSLERDGDGATLSIANALWVQQDFDIHPAFTRAAQDRYGADAQPVDFVSAPDQAVNRINAWVMERTNERITDLISRDMISGDTRLIVTNAVWFLGDWAAPFDATSTSEQPFHLADGTTRPIPLMHQEGRFRYLETETAQILDMPYADERLSMTVLLPRRQGHLPELEAGIGDMLPDWLSRLDAAPPRAVLTHIPRVQVELRYQLIPALTALGMGIAFEPAADFSGIADAALFIDQVVHNTFLRIDEKGTEAAAATGIGMRLTSAPVEPPPVFRADHPFLFLIRDRESGALLFFGRVADPEAPPAE